MKQGRALGIVFANVHDDLVADLTANRAVASIPFGGRYRIIDFVLSNFVNAGISKVGLIPKYNYHSLMDHLGSGKPWDLDRKSGGLYILPPYLRPGMSLNPGHIESLDSIRSYISHSKEEYIVLCDSDVVCNFDLKDMIKSHTKSGADITIAYKNGPLPKNYRDIMALQLEKERITKISLPDKEGQICNFSLDVIIMNRLALLDMVSKAVEENATHMWRDLFLPRVESLKIFGYEVTAPAWVIDSPETYAKANFALLNPEIRKAVFAPERPVYTKVRDDVPAKYGLKSKVSNSLIADGCVVEGTVKNSILFRGVKVASGAVIENCIIMQDSFMGENVNMKYVISDKNVTVQKDRQLCGAETQYMYIRKSAKV